ncbi:rubrerythrin family protein [Coprobacter sp. LH1063]|uniref:Rubrerythrin family protein n=2 Tax=Coprobacter tertius TaxID=2944915 RepID=A0ABT1MD79_9BACT|nr:rubrerythrin family protein [Coprobacter tertius]MCP9610575.1 rubrerythrin family protein [Coprobacter tertius]
MKSIQGTLTEQNLLKAFAGESQARNRYSLFAEVAQMEGYQQISSVFLETAEQEREHAKRFFDFMTGGEMLTITADYPAGRIGTTKENLLEAAEGEKLEWSSLYSDFAGVALEEGFKDVSIAFKMIAKVEEFHEWRYRKLLSRLEDGTVFKREEPIKWQCRNCGFVFEGKEPPAKCPACLHPQAYFEPKRDNY